MADHNEISGIIIGCAIRVHTTMGSGLFENVYERILARDLRQLDLHVQRQTTVPFLYDDIYFKKGFRADLIVDRQVVVEIKSVSRLAPIHSQQLLTYIRLLDLRLGLLLNFGEPLLKYGIKRVANRA